MSTNLEPLLEKFQGNSYPGMLRHLGEHLGVTAESLTKLALGFAPIVEFKKGKNFQGWWVIPERDADGEPKGLSLRSPHDFKAMYPGSKHGLIFEVNPNHERGGASYQHGASNWSRTMDAGVLCAVCGKPDGCLVSAENPDDPRAVICIRVKDGARQPMKFGFLHILKAEGEIKASSSVLPDSLDPIVIVEGMSDTAAAMDLGLVAVGRPSNLACLDELAELVRGRPVILCGENDKKADGTWPGKDGVVAAFQVLKKVCSDIKIIFPPDSRKDFRAWKVKDRLTREAFLASVAEHGESAVTTAEDEALLDKLRSCSDTGNMLRLVKKCSGSVLYVGGQAHIYDGKRFAPDHTGEITKLAITVARDIFKEAQEETDNGRRADLGKHAMASQSASRISSMTSLARPYLSVSPDAVDADPWLLNTQNCVVDLRNKSSIPHNPTHRLTKICNASFNPQAKAPLFNALLEYSFSTHPSLIPYLQKALGYGATGWTTEQVLFFFFGGGSNGKTTILDAIGYALGDYYGKAAPDLLMARSHSAHPTEIADLQGKRLMVFNETRSGHQFDGARMKELTGETQLKARRMREDFFQFRASHKIFVCSNVKPFVSETDHGFWRRMRLIPFVETVAEKDKDTNLPKKLQAEADGILSWIVDGAFKWAREGLTSPPEVEEATRDYRSEMDVIGMFLADCCVQGESFTSFATALYATYQQWAQANGEYVSSQKKFGSQLRDRGFRDGRCPKTGRTTWRGIAVLERKDNTDNGRVAYG